MAKSTRVHHGKDRRLYNEGISPETRHIVPELFDTVKEPNLSEDSEAKPRGSVEVWKSNGTNLESPKDRKARLAAEDLKRQQELEESLKNFRESVQ